MKAYYQIPVNKKDIPKTAVTTPFGLFEFVSMPFGLRNAAQTFQRMINQVVQNLDFCFVYLDDIVIASSSLEEHLNHLRILFKKLGAAGLCINVLKYVFGVSEIDFLGYKVLEFGIKPLKDKVESILNFEKPKTIVQLRRFLGMIDQLLS